MDSKASLFMQRADNEMLAAISLKKLSEDEKGLTAFALPKGTTFYSSVISHSYYAVFYSAKAYLISKNIELPSKQGQHQQVYFKFKKLVKEGIIDKELLKIYEDVKIKAEALLDIIKTERTKRHDFTYETLPQANKSPAEESLKNAEFFLSHIKKFIEEKKNGSNKQNN